jgi:hypothetical protein
MTCTGQGYFTPELANGATHNFSTSQRTGLRILGAFPKNCLQISVKQSAMTARILSFRQEI